MRNWQRQEVPKMSFVVISALILMFAFMTARVQAAPLFNIPITIEQPDGTSLDAFISGDEFFNYMHDSEGRIIIQHPETGFWVYAVLDVNGMLSASDRVAINNGRFYDANSRVRVYQHIASQGITTADIDFVINSHLVRSMDVQEDIIPFGAGIEPAGAGFGIVRANPVSGVIENVVILVTFACDNNPTISPALYGVIEDMFNGPQSSLRSYMHTASGGMLTLNSTLVGMNNNTVIMYRDTQYRGYFMPFNVIDNPIGYDPTVGANGVSEGHVRGRQLLARAIAAIDGSNLLDGKVLNTINPSRVDGVTFILTGNPVAWASFLWPHSWTLSGQNATLGGVAVHDYSLLLLGDNYISSPVITRSTIVHEQLHIFGMPDFYRYTHPGMPVGRWDIMSHSNNALFQFSNTHAMRRYVGWGDSPVEITSSGTFTLHPLGTPGEVTAFAIPVEGRQNEFILLEYRSSMNPTAYDNFLATSTEYRAGLVISRINTMFRGNAESGAPAFRDEVYIFRPGTMVRNAATSDVAFASLSANSGRISFGDAQGTGYYGIIYTHEGYNTGIEIYNVSVAGSTITFSVNLGGANTTPQTPEQALRAAVASVDGTIYLTQDITLTQGPLIIPSGRNINLKGSDGVARQLIAGGDFNVIEIGADNSHEEVARLTLEYVNITRAPFTMGSGIVVRLGGHLTLRSGTITGHNQGAVHTIGTFIMEGGEITDNTASNMMVNTTFGVPAAGVTNRGNFTLVGGVISHNNGQRAGGVDNAGVTVNSVFRPGVFTMEGGVISNNTATGANGGGGVSNMSIFNMNDGIISHNTALRGGGVTNMVASATFTMAGGEIYRNSATQSGGSGGGGVLNMSSATFVMDGGLISHNISVFWAGGVSNGSAFTMRGGAISNNTAAQNGGGIGMLGAATFNMEGGEITGNTGMLGGGIGIMLNTSGSNYGLRAGRLSIGAGAIFANNFALFGNGIPNRNPIDDALYASNIHGTQWTYPFTQGFNNFDIEYSGAASVTVRPLNFELNGTDANPVTPESVERILVLANTPIMQATHFPANPSRVGYSFAGWYLNAGLTQALVSATNMPNNNTTTLYARWETLPNRDITVNVQGGGTAVANVNSARAGTVITLTATPGTGYAFSHWQAVSGGVTLSSATTASTSFTMPDNDVVILAVFAAAPTVTWISIPPHGWIHSVAPGRSSPFHATVHGANNPPQAVTWTVEGNESDDTFISDSGLLTVSANETARNLVVRATSTLNTSISGIATVLVTRPVVHEIIILYDEHQYSCCCTTWRDLAWMVLEEADGNRWPFISLDGIYRPGYVFSGSWRDMISGYYYHYDPGMIPIVIQAPRVFAPLWVVDENWVPPASRNITVNIQGNGTATVSVASSPSDEWIQLWAMPGVGYDFIEWQVVSGGVAISNATALSSGFLMPDNDVIILAVFAATPTITQITVAADWWVTMAFPPGQSHTFMANVIGTNNPPRTVIWTVEGQRSSNTTISATGVLAVGADETADTLTIRATSTVNPSISGILRVTVACSTTRHDVTILFGVDLCCHIQHNHTMYAMDVHDGYALHFRGYTHLYPLFDERDFVNTWYDIISGDYYSETCTALIQGPRIFVPIVMRRELTQCCCGHYFYEYHQLTQFTYYDTTFGRQGNGTATATPRFAPAGRIITIIATPSAGYEFVEWVPTVTTTGEEIILSSTTSTSATFSMPNSNVMIWAVFAPVSPTVTQVTVTKWHPDAIFRPGQTYRFLANVRGELNPPQTVIWTVEGNESSGTSIANTGHLTIGIDETATNIIVRATSTVNPSISGTVAMPLTSSTAMHEIVILHGLDLCCCHHNQELTVYGVFDGFVWWQDFNSPSQVLYMYEVYDGYFFTFNHSHVPTHYDEDFMYFTWTWLDMESGEIYYYGSNIFIRGRRIFAPIFHNI
ncbi:MAG: InlB B-repeat-containing protein [Defluviitaleaceae bacterium]|nr:InlB B-repeat-containing protein [Defluviitaleaceae bacterium]